MSFWTRTLPTILLGLLCISLSNSQAQATLSGRVLIEGKTPAEFNNVILLTASDSNAVKLELTDEQGYYRIEGIDAGRYFLRVTGLGMATTQTDAFDLASDQVLNLPDVTIEEIGSDLATVEVIARKPLLEQKAGRLVVNVDQTITGQGGSVVDLLRKVPGIVIVGNQIRMAGREGVTILIDGRPTRYMDVESLLREMPADNIDRIEVVSQPGSSYDAEGTGGVINIILKKNVLLGTNGNASIGAGYGQLWKYRANANLSHRAGPLNLNLGAGFNRRTWFNGLELDRFLPDSAFIQNNRDYGKPLSFSLRGGVDYDITDRHKVGVNGRWQRSDNVATNSSFTRIVGLGGEELQSFTTFNDQDRFWRSYSIDGFYKFSIDTSGQEISADVSYSNYLRDAEAVLRTEGADFNTRRNLEPAATELLVARLDYKLPINKNWRFEAGAKYSIARLDNELDSRVLIGDAFVIDRGLSNRFQYDEDISALYASVLYEKEDLEIKAGLRYEGTNALGYNVTIDSQIIRDYSQLFPSLSMAMPVAGPLGMSVAYSYRIERPSYFNLNPFVEYLDPFTFSRGNPLLLPELTHSGQFSLTYEKQPFLNLTYDYTSDVMTDVIEQNDATGAAFQTTVNLDRYIRYGGSLFFPLDFIAKSVSGYGGVMVFYHDYESEYLGAQYAQDQWSVTGFLNLSVNLPADWKAEVSGWYQGAGVDGILSYQPLYGVDLGLEKKFLDNRWRLQISAEGIIQRFWRGRLDYQNLDFNILSTWEAPIVNVRLTYNFGNRFLKKENRRSAADEERSRMNME